MTDVRFLPSGAPVLETKLTPSVRRPGIVDRPRLVALLNDPRTPLVAVVAPAGYGKSTAVGLWAEQVDRPVAWVSLDSRDNDPYQLLGYLQVALSDRVDLPDDLRDALGAAAPSVWTSAVPRFGSALSSLKTPISIVLDDFDALDAPEAVEAVLQLAAHLRPPSNMVLCGRTTGRLSVARLIAQDQLQVIDARTLAFDPDETMSVMASAGVTLPAAEIHRVAADLEGWPAGVYLTARSLASDPAHECATIDPPSGDATAAIGSARWLPAEFIRTELLAGLSTEDQTFARQTAILERLSGPLCDAVTGRTGSAARLRAWANSNLFLIPLDDSRTWFRYHHLLRDVLLDELRAGEPGLIRTLHDRAGSWYLDQDLREQAMEAFMVAQNISRVAELLPSVLRQAFNSGRVETARRWADWFEATGALDEHVSVAVIGSQLPAYAGDPVRAEQWLAAADRWSPVPDDPTATYSEGVRAVGRAFAMRSGADQMRADAMAAVGLGDALREWRFAALGLLGIATQVSGDGVAADRIYAELLAKPGLEIAATTSAIVMAFRAGLAMDLGEWDRAADLIAAATAQVQRRNLTEQAPGLAVDAVAARLALQQARFDEARTLVSRSQHLRPLLSYAVPWLAVRTRLDLAKAQLGLGEPGAARMLRREIRDVLVHRPNVGALKAEIAELDRRLREAPGGSSGASTLTVAELRLLPLLCTHLSFKEIGERLFISGNTVKTEAISIYRKLEADSRGSAVGRAMEIGLIESAY